MTENQWGLLCDIVDGNTSRHEIGFIIDSPWLPGWYNIPIIDYYTSDELWFGANKKASELVRRCKEVDFPQGRLSSSKDYA